MYIIVEKSDDKITRVICDSFLYGYVFEWIGLKDDYLNMRYNAPWGKFSFTRNYKTRGGDIRGAIRISKANSSYKLSVLDMGEDKVFNPETGVVTQKFGNCMRVVHLDEIEVPYECQTPVKQTLQQVQLKE